MKRGSTAAVLLLLLAFAGVALLLFARHARHRAEEVDRIVAAIMRHEATWEMARYLAYEPPLRSLPH